MVVVANTALARLIGCVPDDVIGTPLAKITQRLQPVRSCSLVVGGRPRTALIFERRPARIETRVAEAVDCVLAEHYPLVRQTLRVSFEQREQVVAMLSPAAIQELVTLAMLDMTAIFTAPMPANHLRISVLADGSWAVIELAATGAIADGPDIEHLGAIICAARVRAAGGQFAVDASRPGTRVVRISLPVES
jgi:hypothetical protein